MQTEHGQNKVCLGEVGVGSDFRPGAVSATVRIHPAVTHSPSRLPWDGF